MTDHDQINQALKNAFWITDVLVEGLPEVLDFVLSIRHPAQAAGVPELDADAARAAESLQGMAVALGILRGALADLRIALPEGEADNG